MAFQRTAKQLEASRLHAGDAAHIMLYGGSRSGKTVINLRNIILRALKCESRHFVFRLHRTAVESTIWHETLPFVLNNIFPTLTYKLHFSKLYITFDNRSEIWFAGLDEGDRVEKILGREGSTMYFNECSQFNNDFYNERMGGIYTRLAAKNILQKKFYYDCNPTTTKHWTYKLFVEKVSPVTGLPLDDPDDYAALVMNPKDNLQNLDPDYLKTLRMHSKKAQQRFEYGQFISDTEGALWNYDLIVQAQSKERFSENQVVIGVDPAVTNNKDSDETGIIVASSDGYNVNILEDASMKASPDVWMQAVVNLYEQYRANFIVVETNQGGDLIESLLRTINSNLPIHKVHAKKGKFARAEPVVALYEQGKVWHNKKLDKLENQMLEYVPLQAKYSPDRIDALVYAVTALVLENRGFEVSLLTW